MFLSAALVLCLAVSVAGLAQSIPNWAPNVAYSVGSLVMFQGVEYKCIQAHTSQSDWTPPATPALWQPVSGSPNSDTDAGANTHTNAESDSYTQPRWRRVRRGLELHPGLHRRHDGQRKRIQLHRELVDTQSEPDDQQRPLRQRPALDAPHFLLRRRWRRSYSDADTYASTNPNADPLASGFEVVCSLQRYEPHRE